MIRDLYPLSTQDGNPIPLDIIRPLGVIRLSIPIGTGSSLVALGIPVPILVLRSTVDCFIRFGTVASIPSFPMLPDTCYLPANETIVISPALTDISVIGDILAGVLTIQFIDQWAGLGKETIYRK
jgi:hypothetical protein